VEKWLWTNKTKVNPIGEKQMLLRQGDCLDFSRKKGRSSTRLKKYHITYLFNITQPPYFLSLHTRHYSSKSFSISYILPSFWCDFQLQNNDNQQQRFTLFPSLLLAHLNYLVILKNVQCISITKYLNDQCNFQRRFWTNLF
jgi:hypothetical protein